MSNVYRVYLVGGADTQWFADRAVERIIYCGPNCPAEEVIDGLRAQYGSRNLLTCIEDEDTPMPKIVSDLLGGR